MKDGLPAARASARRLRIQRSSCFNCIEHRRLRARVSGLMGAWSTRSWLATQPSPDGDLIQHRSNDRLGAIFLNEMTSAFDCETRAIR